MNDELAEQTNAAPGAEPPLPPVPARGSRWFSWRAVGLGLALFACGCIVGAGGTLLAVRRHVVNLVRQPPELSAERATVRMRRVLGLTDAQAKQIDEIYKRRFAALRETRLRVGAEMEEMREEIAKVLTKDQVAVWRERADLIEGGLPGRGPMPPGGPEGPGMGNEQRPGNQGPDGALPGAPGQRRGAGLYYAPGGEPGQRQGLGPNAPPVLGPGQRPGGDQPSGPLQGPGARAGLGPGVRPGGSATRGVPAESPVAAPSPSPEPTPSASAPKAD